MSNLYHVQSDDRPLFVVANSLEQAIDKWRAFMRIENESHLLTDAQLGPDGVALVAESDELLIDPACFNCPRIN